MQVIILFLLYLYFNTCILKKAHLPLDFSELNMIIYRFIFIVL